MENKSLRNRNCIIFSKHFWFFGLAGVKGGTLGPLNQNSVERGGY